MSHARSKDKATIEARHNLQVERDPATTRRPAVTGRRDLAGSAQPSRRRKKPCELYHRQDSPSTSALHEMQRGCNVGSDERRPTALIVRPENIPSELKAIDRWVVWCYELRDGKWTKPLHNARSGDMAKVNDPSTWCTFEKALAAYNEDEDWDGIGFVLTDDDDIGGIDIDHRIIDGDIDADALADLQEIDTYTEFSPSGEGLRAIFRGELPPGERKTGDFEIYDDKRFLTITGHRVEGFPSRVESRQAEIEAFHRRRIARPVKVVRRKPRGEAQQRRVQRQLSDDQILRLVSQAKNGAKFGALFDGDDSHHQGDTSAADLALCSMIAFYTQDREQIDRLFRSSGRIRDKWDTVHYNGGETYGEHTINVALEGLDDTYRPPRRVKRNRPHSPTVPKPGDWPELATAFLAQRERPVVSYQGEFYGWQGACWTPIPDATIRAELQDWLANARHEADGGLVRWRTNTGRQHNAVDALRNLTHLGDVTPPCWIAGRHEERRQDLLAVRNGLLHIPERRLLPPTSDFFNLTSLPIDYDPDAPEPTNWLNFLEDIFEHDPSSIAVLQEILGEIICGDGRYQKTFVIIGPTRSGKGVITRTFEAVVGDTNVVATTYAQLGQTFEKESLIGKSLATITDARFTGRTDLPTVIETLLTISGGDTVSISRKHRQPWIGRLDVRFLISCNQVPVFPDPSGALANRFVPLTTQKSYLDREDLELEHRIANELPGILNWALDGWKRLERRGEFKLSPSGQRVRAEMTLASAPVTEFVRARCEIGPDYTVEKAELHKAWRKFASDHGLSPQGEGWLIQQLREAYPGLLDDYRPNRGGKRTRCYRGLRLRP